MNNMDIWNNVKQVPPQFLKEIQAGRLKGKSDINPQWRYQVMTEQFGLCGIGWKWELKRLWTEPTQDGQLFAFAEVAIYTKPTPQSPWSDPIPGIGGSMLIEQERAGLHANDEGYKMAITDAIGTGLKFLGVAADVYAGLWDGSKYREVKDKPAEKPQEAPPTAKPASVVEPPTKPEVKAALDKTEAHLAQGRRITEGFNIVLGIGDDPAAKANKLKEWNLKSNDFDGIEAKLKELAK